MTNPTILFVDDEPSVLRALRRIFRKESVNILTASSGTDGLDLLLQHAVNVVISDQRMPGMCGTDFLKEVRILYPDTVRCILSGYAEMDSVVAAINDGNVYRFISKPWNDLEIIQILNDCLAVANKSLEEHQARVSLKNRATALEEESEQFAELLELQKSLLKSSRDVLDHLPVPVVALDGQGRMIYTNRRFSSEYGHLPGTVLGQLAGEPWARAVIDNIVGDAEFSVNDEVHNAQIEQINIGGYKHSLIAMSPNRK